MGLEGVGGGIHSEGMYEKANCVTLVSSFLVSENDNWGEGGRLIPDSVSLLLSTVL